MLNQFLAGAAVISLLVISLFFLRFWRRTRDRLFVFFALAFLIMMVERIFRASMPVENEWVVFVYGIRLGAFVFIICGIIDKNRRIT